MATCAFHPRAISPKLPMVDVFAVVAAGKKQGSSLMNVSFIGPFAQSEVCLHCR